MDNDMDNTNNLGEGAAFSSRPFGFWLRTVDHLLEREFAEAFAAEGVTRRDWRVLNVIGGDVDAPELLERLRGKKLRTLDERGWIARTDAGWTLTDEGRAAKERLGAIVDGIRSKVTSAVSEDDYATTIASLEAIARGLGWDGSVRMPRGRGFGRRRGFGPNFGDRRGFGPEGGDRRGFGPDGGHHGHGHGHGGGHGECGHGRRHGGHAGHRMAQDAYERGFHAGFTHGERRRDA